MELNLRKQAYTYESDKRPEMALKLLNVDESLGTLACSMLKCSAVRCSLNNTIDD